MLFYPCGAGRKGKQESRKAGRQRKEEGKKEPEGEEGRDGGREGGVNQINAPLNTVIPLERFVLKK